MSQTITVKEVPIDEIVRVNQTITEFGEAYAKNYLQDRYQGRDHLLIIGYVDHKPAGYIVGYDRYQDGSFYCWMAGVNPVYRRLGVLTALMDYQTEWAKSHGYNKIKIRTRNNRRAMLANLIKRGFYLTEVSPRPDIQDHRISLELPL